MRSNTIRGAILRGNQARYLRSGLFQIYCDQMPCETDDGGPSVTETPVLASNYTFDPFARHKFYHDVNQSLVHRAISRLDAAHPAGKPVRVVELASGTGAVTELILDELERLGRPGTVIGVEPSPEAIEIATDRLASRG